MRIEEDVITYYCVECEMFFYLKTEDVDGDDRLKITSGFDLRVHCPCCCLTDNKTNIEVVDY